MEKGTAVSMFSAGRSLLSVESRAGGLSLSLGNSCKGLKSL